MQSSRRWTIATIWALLAPSLTWGQSVQASQLDAQTHSAPPPRVVNSSAAPPARASTTTTSTATTSESKTTAGSSAKPDLDDAPIMRGTGFFVASGVLAAGGLAANIATILRVRDPNTCNIEADQEQTVLQCAKDSGEIVVLRLAAMTTNLAAVGFAWGGGHVRGRYDAWMDVKHNRHRRVLGQFVLGATLGGAGMIWSIIAFPVFGAGEFSKCRDETCLREKATVYYITREAAALSSVVGFALAGHAVRYNRMHRRFSRRESRDQVDLRLVPTISAAKTGLSLVGRF